MLGEEGDSYAKWVKGLTEPKSCGAVFRHRGVPRAELGMGYEVHLLNRGARVAGCFEEKVSVFVRPTGISEW